MLCSVCGASLLDDAKFCSQCGADLVGNKKKPTYVEVLTIRRSRQPIGCLPSMIGCLPFLCWIPANVDGWYEAVFDGVVMERSSTFVVRTELGDNPMEGVSDEKEAARARKFLIDKLQREGWEPIIAQSGEINSMKRVRR